MQFYIVGAMTTPVTIIGKPDQNPPSSALQIATSFVAPATVLFGANAYFTGFIYRSFVADYYGISASFAEESVQVTIARGFAINILGIILLLVIFVLAKLLVTLTNLALGIIFANVRVRGLNTIGRKIRSWVPRARFLMAVQLGYITLTFGVLSGSFGAFVKQADTEARIDNRCSRCYFYTVKRGQLIGVMILQDTKNSVIRTRTGISIVANDQIKSIRPITRIEPLRSGLFVSAWGYRPR